MGTIARSLRRSARSPVHPHGRGDNLRVVGVVLPAVGSPPRAWGQSRSPDCSWGWRRFTPTGVGTMRHWARVARNDSVHPHGRGDNDFWRCPSCRVTGSPPRAWGQSVALARRAVATRFTPTGVGTMAPRRARVLLRSVHPHGRGDNSHDHKQPYALSGSPPRAWGQYAGYVSTTPSVRFTPTGVGTIAQGGVGVITPPVHPHGRGDNRPPANHVYGLDGSPPRAWGQLYYGSESARSRRFTPTGVGTIPARGKRRSQTQVHPHGRGDN